MHSLLHLGQWNYLHLQKNTTVTYNGRCLSQGRDTDINDLLKLGLEFLHCAVVTGEVECKNKSGLLNAFLCFVSTRGLDPLWMRRSRSNCWWTLMWWWGVVTVPTLSSSMVPSSERSVWAITLTLLFDVTLDVFETNHWLFLSGGLLDLHGTNVYLIRQILQICILCIRSCHPRRNTRQNNISGM